VKNANKIHFIGIGGIGVSSLARFYLFNGYSVSGSDESFSEITKELQKLGAKIFLGHSEKNINKNLDSVVYSPAISFNNPEMKKARDLGIKILSYPQALGELTKKLFTIAVCGSHGKSTTAAMIGVLLAKAGLDPTVIVGTKVKEFNDSNFRPGKSNYLVIEADEHFSSFLNYWPKVIVLTNIEKDHLDFYKNLNNILKAFKKFVSHLPSEGIIIANRDDKNVYKFFSGQKNIIWYSLKDKEREKIKNILKIPGDFNVSNALAALKVGRIFKIKDEKFFQILSGYKGSWRRFDAKKIKFNKKTIILINDYGHHPTQLKLTLKAAREKYPNRKIFCIFQPHQYQRTYYLYNDFIRALRESSRCIDLIILTDIYTVLGREKKEIMKKVSSQKLVSDVKKSNVIYVSRAYLLNYLKTIKSFKNNDVLIIMGAGDIYNFSFEIKKC